MALYDAQYCKDVIAMVNDELDATVQTVDDSMQGTPLGMKTPTPQQLMGFYADQVAKYPPAWWMTPQGPRFGSIWVLLLDEVEGGKEWNDRLLKAAGRVM